MRLINNKVLPLLDMVLSIFQLQDLVCKNNHYCKAGKCYREGELKDADDCQRPRVDIPYKRWT